MSGLLYCILREFLATGSNVFPENDLETYIDTCNGILNGRMESFEVLAVPTFENIFSLALGVSSAQSKTRPGVHSCRVLADTSGR